MTKTSRRDVYYERTDKTMQNNRVASPLAFRIEKTNKVTDKVNCRGRFAPLRIPPTKTGGEYFCLCVSVPLGAPYQLWTLVEK